MKKFFNDHVGTCFVAAVILAGVALYFALKNKKRLEEVTGSMAQLLNAAATEPVAPTE